MLYSKGNKNIGVWHSLVVRLVRDQEAAGSNPVTPTKIAVHTLSMGGGFVLTGFEGEPAMNDSPVDCQNRRNALSADKANPVTPKKHQVRIYRPKIDKLARHT